MTGIKITGAGAGSGKTYYLTQRLAEEVRAGLQPDAILATTFTRKAAGELRERIRRLLIEWGRHADAQRIFEGYIGTVHSVCNRLLSEYAVDAGLSPAVEVLPEGDDTRFFRIGVSAIAEVYAEKLEPVAERLELNGSGSGYAQTPDWRSEVEKVVDLARANAISPASLKAAGAHSAETLQRLLCGAGPDSHPDAGHPSVGHRDAADADAPGGAADTGGAGASGGTGERSIAERVAEVAEAVLPALKAIEEPKGSTKAATKLLEDFLRSHATGGTIPWSHYAKLAKQPVNKDAEGLFDGVNAAAAEFAQSAEFRRDLETMTHGVLGCAADALEAFDTYKRTQGFMDYTDLETRVLALARENERVRTGISESGPRIFVDEFQDTSPIQLALFLALHELSGNSLWVGDPKQAIYGFRGADPALMSAAVKRLGTHETLPYSWRSREELVRFSNAVFAPGFTARGYDSVELKVPEQRAAEAAGGRIETWYLASTNKEGDAAAVAAGVAELLAERPDLAPGDIAVLCRKNADCAAIASQLGRLGVDASVGHGTLAQADECRLATAALRFLADERDTLALAEIVHLHPDHGAHHVHHAQSAQTAPRGKRPQKDGAAADDGAAPWLSELTATPQETKDRRRADPLIQRLEDARAGVARRAPDEALEQVIALLNLPRVVAAWPRSARRRANLDALRGACAQYLASCDARRSAATVLGFIRHLGEQTPEQATGTGDRTVQVLTYHGAKGLEWRVVVLTDLNSGTRDGSRTAFGSSIESDAPLNLDDPLAGRSVRYWPWPFGRQEKIDGLTDAIAASPQHREAVERSRDESLRLLYVGVTRAREELVLTARRKVKGDSAKVEADWVEELTDADGNPVIRWATPVQSSAEGEPAILRAGTQAFETLTRVLSPDHAGQIAESPPAEGPPTEAAPTGYRPPAAEAPVDYPPARLAPSSRILHEPAADAPDGSAAPQTPDAPGTPAAPDKPVSQAPSVTLFADLGERIPLAGGSADSGSAGGPTRDRPSSAGSGSGGADETALGNALHAVYAATYPGISEDRLLRTTERLLEAYGLAHAVAAPNVVLTYRRLTEFLSSSFEVTQLHREWPISLRLENGSRAEGWVDLLVETAEGCVILDHKSFAGSDAAQRVAGFAPQLRLYRDALEAAGAGPVIATLIHLPMLGKVYHVQ